MDRVNHGKLNVELKHRLQTKHVDWTCCFSLTVPLRKLLSLQLNVFRWGLRYCWNIERGPEMDTAENHRLRKLIMMQKDFHI